MKTRFLFFSLLALVLTLGAPLAPARFSGASAATPLPPATPTGDGPWVVKVYYADRAQLDRLAARIEPWEVRRDLRYAVVAVDRASYEGLLAQGFRLEVDAEQTARLNQPLDRLPGQVTGIPSYPCYRTVEETYATAAALATAHPTLATWLDIGDSWEKVTPGGNAGYDLQVLRLTNAAIPGPKPKLFVMSSIHAREYTPAELLTRFAELLVNQYNVDPDVTWLLDYHEIHLLLQGNPDGRKIAETGFSWRKNTDNDDGCTSSSYWGTDLNRNYPFQWACCNGSSGDACDETYRGPSSGSEPETQAVLAYVRAQFPDQRAAPLDAAAPITATGIFLDLHSYGQLVLWPWGFTASAAPNGTALQTLGRKFAYFNGHSPEQSYGLYATDGTTDDFAYGELGLAAYTFEMGTSFFQSCSVFENTIVPNNLPALLYAAKVVRTPYLTPAGPDALAVTVTPTGTAAGAPLSLTATLNDTRYNNTNGTEPAQAIAAAEYYVDTPPWVTDPTPVAHPLAALDGAFNQTVETAGATIETAALQAGRHIVFVRGQDAAGNWGPFSAAFFTVTLSLPPQLSVEKSAAVAQVEAGTALSFTLRINNSGGPATSLRISDTLPAGVTLAGASHGGTLLDDTVVWSGLNVSPQSVLTVSLSVTATCLPSGTLLVNHAYTITAAEWPTPTTGAPVAVAVTNEGISAGFSFGPLPLLANRALTFTNQSRNATAYSWDFGDGATATATAPAHTYLAPGAYTVALTATNVCYLPATITRTLQVEHYALALRPVTPTLGGDPGQTVTYTLWLTNTGTLSDRFSLSRGSTAWTTTLVTETALLAAGESVALPVHVAVPANAKAGDQATVLLTARSLNDPRVPAAAASLTLTTTANSLYRVAIGAPVTAQLARPGETVTYTVRISNTGNAADTIFLTRTNPGWPTAFSWSSQTIAPGWRPLVITVTVPVTVTVGEMDTALIRASGQGTPAELSLTTRVLAGQLYLPLVLRTASGD